MWSFQNVSNMFDFLLKIPSMEYIFMSELQSLFISCVLLNTGFPGGSTVKKTSAMQEMQEMRIRSFGREDPLEEEIATHSSILAWKILWTEEPGRL